MKNIKKLLSIVMVLAMVLSLGVSAFATDVTLPEDAKDHTMVAYQIFKGEQLEPSENNAQLGVTDWGANVTNPGAFLEALVTAGYNQFKKDDGTVMTAVEAAKAIDAVSKVIGTDKAKLVDFANAVAAAVEAQGTTGTTLTYPTTTGLANGYWVIVDDTTGLAAGETRSTTLLEVVGAKLTLQDKIEKPTLKKEVNDQKIDVAGLGESVRFDLTATLPGNYHDFQKYYLAFEDDMDKGLTYNEDLKVYIVDGEGNRTNISTYFTVMTSDSIKREGGTHIQAKCDHLKDIEGLGDGSVIVAEYTATVNENAVVRNYNDAHIEYSRDPNEDDGGEPTPGPDDVVTVVTFTVDGDKTKENGEALPGAGFTLLKELDAAPAGATPVKVTWETLGVLAKGAIVEYNGKIYENWNGEQFADEDGNFGFDKLGVGTYVLAETTVPDGYNRADDISFTVEKTYSDGKVSGAQALQDGKVVSKIEITPADSEGIIDEDVINKEGLELPETGGIGTTIFYIVGAILVAGAVILLVTKRRVNGAEK